MIIDVHTHVFPPAILKNRAKYIDRDHLFAELYSDPRAKLAAADDIICIMDKCGVEKSVVLNLGWQDHELCIETNDYILDSVARYPDRLIGFAAVSLMDGDKAIREIERCLLNGIKGIGELRPDLQSPGFLDKSPVNEVINAIIDSGLILLIHASEPLGHRYPGKGIITPESIYHFILKYPDLKLICAHWGGGLPFYALMPEVGKALENVYFDSAATPFLYKAQIFKQVTDIIGCQKILFGSDSPLLSPARILDQLESVGLNTEEKEKIRGGNAQALFAPI
jgi:predicted TIM-barrel fold metal-dependent hydrolase